MWYQVRTKITKLKNSSARDYYNGYEVLKMSVKERILTDLVWNLSQMVKKKAMKWGMTGNIFIINIRKRKKSTELSMHNKIRCRRNNTIK